MGRTPSLYVHDRLLAQLRALRSGPCEVGGWLLGYWTGRRDTLVVTHATPPSRGTPSGIRISGRRHRGYFDQAWDASAGAVTFVGDWHTHPGGPSTPSERDRAALEKLAAKPDYGTPEPVVAIAETPRWPWRNSEREIAFFVRRDREEVIELEPIVSSELPPPAAAVPLWRWPRKRAA